MPKPMRKDQLELMHNLYYKDNEFYGRDKTYAYLRNNHPDMNITRRQVAEWLLKHKDIKKPEIFVISKIVKPTVNNNNPHYEIKYRKKSDNTIEPRDQLLKDIPKMLNAYDKKHNVKWFKNGNIQKFTYDK